MVERVNGQSYAVNLPKVSVLMCFILVRRYLFACRRCFLYECSYYTSVAILHCLCFSRIDVGPSRTERPICLCMLLTKQDPL